MKSRRLLILMIVLAAVLVIFALDRILAPRDSAAAEARLIDDFARLYYARGIHYKTSWLGVMTLENPCDMWAIQEIIAETKPEFIVETGTYKGGGAFFYASILSLLGEGGKVITVDIKPFFEGAAGKKIFQERVEFIEGSSVSKEVVDRIAARIKGSSRVMVTLDSDHHKDHVLNELRLYSKFVSVGAYLIVQDTAHNGHPFKTTYGQGPMEAMEEFLKDNKDFVSDPGREKFLLTFHPRGYLKRVR